MSFLIKLVYPAFTTLVVGGGACVGVATSSTGNHSPYNSSSLPSAKKELFESSLEALKQQGPKQSPKLLVTKAQSNTLEAEATSQVSHSLGGSTLVNEASLSSEETEVTVSMIDPEPELTIGGDFREQEMTTLEGVGDSSAVESIPKEESGPDPELIKTEEEQSYRDSQTTEEPVTLSEQSEEQPIEDQDVGVGNCTIVDNDPQVISKLKDGVTYLSASCDNSQAEDVELDDWIGTFPVNLLKNSGQGLRRGNKFSIYVKDQVFSDEYTGSEPYQTLFISNRFTEREIIGRWGGNLVDTDDESNIIFAVEVSDSEASNSFYISKRA